MKQHDRKRPVRTLSAQELARIHGGNGTGISNPHWVKNLQGPAPAPPLDHD